MNILFFSDTHGSCDALERIMELDAELKPDLIAFLGDALYHGPRNEICADYNPRGAAKMFNDFKDKLVAVRGNCDSEVDQVMLEFPLMESYTTIFDGGRRFFLTHGHIWGENHIPPLPFGTIVASGHTHVARIAEGENGMVFFNPGSTTRPKHGAPPSYGFYDGHGLSVRELFTSNKMLSLALDGAKQDH